MKNHPIRALVVLVFSLVFAGCASSSSSSSAAPAVTEMGNNTYSITCAASTGFTRNVAKYKQQALDEAAKYCATHGKQLKVISVTEHKPLFYTQSIASATVVFKALDASDPELTAPVVAEGQPARVTATDDLYTQLTKLDDLRKRGILTEEEFQSEKQKVLSRSK